MKNNTIPSKSQHTQLGYNVAMQFRHVTDSQMPMSIRVSFDVGAANNIVYFMEQIMIAFYLYARHLSMSFCARYNVPCFLLLLFCRCAYTRDASCAQLCYFKSTTLHRKFIFNYRFKMKSRYPQALI